MSSETFIRASGLCFAFDGPDVLHDVGIELRAGSLTAIVGANGSGKSTLIEILAGLRPPRSGNVDRSESVALVVQRSRIPERLPITVRETVAIGTWGARTARRASRRAVDAALCSVGLSAFARRPIHALSGGQRQRALIAQAIVREAGIMLLDEPTAGLDAASRRDMREILRSEAERGRAIAWVTHDEEDVAASDRTVRLVAGRRVA